MILREVRKCRNKGKAVKNNSLVIKQSPSSSSGDICNNQIQVFEFCRNQGPQPGGGWNDDVDPPDFNQLKVDSLDF